MTTGPAAAPKRPPSGAPSAKSSPKASPYAYLEQKAGPDPEAERAVDRAFGDLAAGHVALAEAAAREIAKRVPPPPRVYHLLGLCAHRNGEFGVAVQQVARAIELIGEGHKLFPAFLNDLGVMQRAAGLLDQAIATYRRVIELSPQDANARYNLGNALRARGDHDGAAACFAKAGEISPGYWAAFHNLAGLLHARGETEPARQAYEKALAASPAQAEVHASYAAMLWQAGELAEAGRRFTDALALKPDDGLRLKVAMLVPPIIESTDAIEPSRKRMMAMLDALAQRGLSIPSPASDAAATSFFLAYQGLPDRAIQEKIAQVYRKACPQLAYTAPHCQGDAITAPAVKADRRLKVGFVSARLKNHTIGRLNLGLIATLPKDKIDLKVYATQANVDHFTKAIEKHAPITVLPSDLAAAQRMLGRAGLDIAVFPDVGMDPDVFVLAAGRFAPVQATSWGHPDTTGLETLDYFVSSDLIEPAGAEATYTEQLVRLPTLPTYYYRPVKPTEPVPEVEALRAKIKGAMYLCPQTLFKFHPDFDAILAGILKADPKGTIVLIAGLYPAHAAQIRARLERLAGAEAIKRVLFLPMLHHPKFLALAAAADVMLDTPHFSGGNTSFEALAFGVPIVTWPSGLMRGRTTFGMLRAMELLDTVVDGPEAYVRLAVDLGTSRKRRAALSEAILERNGALYENPMVTQAWLKFLTGAAAGKPPYVSAPRPARPIGSPGKAVAASAAQPSQPPKAPPATLAALSV
ncbi:MAG: tetratricopeptide repeat protein [Alphaproteobacteria bacterium]|nr:tetratricopeptide repeat protein [Alphaproteobacteria bacterium]